MDKDIGLATSLVHVDDLLADAHVAPAIAVTSTYRAAEIEAPLTLAEWDPQNPPAHVYSRYTQNVSTRVEKVIGTLHDGHALTYASGLAAAYAALVHLKPKRIAITDGYHGVYNTIRVYNKSRDIEVPVIDLDDEYQEGDMAWVETPLNPTGEARDIQHYADKVHAVGGKLVVDATFAPPPLQNPLKWGADIVMHSATKYLGGHSDLLSGVLVVPTKEEWLELWEVRTYFGNTMGSLESWLLLRSMRTLHLRITRQSETATALAAWLSTLTTIPVGKALRVYFVKQYLFISSHLSPSGKVVDGVPGGVVVRVQHASLQDKTKFDPATQLTGGYGATFSITLATQVQAKAFPHRLHYWIVSVSLVYYLLRFITTKQCATSLGGVESLIEYRRRSDPTANPCLLRLSVGVEDLKDLKNDLRNGFNDVLDLSEYDHLLPIRLFFGL
ncbi:cystathionine gamma-synthase [Ramaria rubella]|nr:cystathionine gamma-synthase [Ramaria rubella]